MSLIMLIGRSKVRAFAGVSAIAAQLAEVRSFPAKLSNLQESARFIFPIRREDGGESPVKVFCSTYSAAPGPRYVQVSYDRRADEDEADHRALGLHLTFCAAGLPMANSAVVVSESEDEFSESERKQLTTALAGRLSRLHSNATAFVYSPAQAWWVSGVSALRMTAKELQKEGKYAVSHYSERKAELVRSLATEEGQLLWASEPCGACFNASGLEREAFLSHFAAHKTVKGFDGGTTLHSLSALSSLRPDILLLGAPAAIPLIPTATIIAETDFLCLRPEEEAACKGKVIPGMVFNMGEAISALLSHVLAAKTVPEGWKLQREVGEAVEKLLKSRARTEKKQAEVFLTAVKTIGECAIEGILSEAQAKQISIRQAAILKAISVLETGSVV